MNVDSFHFENLLPCNEVYELHHSAKEYYIRHGEGKKSVRKIFAKVKYEDFEVEAIQNLKHAAKNENLTLPPYWEDRHFLLYCYNGGFNVETSIKNMKLHLDWLHNPKWHTITDHVLQILKEGNIYSFGMDKCYRPIIVVNVYMFDLKKFESDEYLAAVCCLLTIMRKHMFVPGHVENWNVIIEANNKSLWSLSSYFDLIKKIIQTLSINFSSTLEKQLILNPPKILSISWGVIEKWLNPETAAKISFASGAAVSQKLLELVDSDQLEEKYGGTVPNLTEFWPPKTHYKSKSHRVIMKKKSTTMNLATEEEKEVFFSLDNISENTYELLKNGKNENSNNQNGNHRKYSDIDRFYEVEHRGQPQQIIMEREVVRTGKFCGLCEASSSSSKSKDEQSSCTLI